jgi:3-oxoacyl-[acyl-carrier protein] reductase
MSEDRKLTGKVAMVFGGSRGIGAAAARRLAREGANVGLTYVSAPDKAADTVRAIAEQGRAGFAIKADSADPTAISDAVTQVVAQLGRLDIVVVNAGILRMGDLQTVSLQELDLMLNVNVRGAWWRCSPRTAAAIHGAPSRRKRLHRRILPSARLVVELAGSADPQ